MLHELQPFATKLSGQDGGPLRKKIRYSLTRCKALLSGQHLQGRARKLLVRI